LARGGPRLRPEAFLSHGPAGQLLGIVTRRERFALHVSLLGVDRSSRGVVCHRPRRLERRDTTRRLGIPVTTVTRTVWDLATTSTPLATRRAFEQAERRGLDPSGCGRCSTPRRAAREQP
jgi:hypothetical protein